jgi:uncharacterized membrane protein YgdD (TMEM256/DUF423 family)
VTPQARRFVLLGAVCALAAVGAGAFGTHGLRNRLDAGLLEVFETAVRYQMYHALALFAVAWLADRNDTAWVKTAGWLFVTGVALFSGSLYILVATGLRWWGAVTPLGGLAFLAGWGCLAVGAGVRGFGSRQDR